MTPVHTDGILDDEDIYRVVHPTCQPVDLTPVVQQPQYDIGDEISLEEPRRTVRPHVGVLDACDIAVGGEVVVCEWEGGNGHDGAGDGGENP